jgi:phosphopantothenoylcysteine decarboxylase/phosphopantothenate--cysteine ligase
MQHYFQDRRILIIVSGSIAAYKTLTLVSLLKKWGAEIKVVLTKHAQEFVTPLSFATLSQNSVINDLFTDPLAHIRLAKWPELILIAPASANIIAKYAQGYAEDIATTILLASTAKVVLAPAMNQVMWAHSAVQENIQKLSARGVDIIGPDIGLQACGDVGLGRMVEAEEIINMLPKYFQQGLLKNKKVLITAGPTQEALDPVRYLTNYSSGKMGYALAASFYYQGAQVILISGPSALKPPQFCKFIAVRSAEEMQAQVLEHVAMVDIMIACAAVGDFRPKKYQLQKIKKDKKNLTLELTKNDDILKKISTHKHRPLLIGFAAETENIIENAKKKLKAKKLDMIIANQVGPNLGFGAEELEGFILTAQQIKPLAKNNKAIVADQIVKEIMLAF